MTRWSKWAEFSEANIKAIGHYKAGVYQLRVMVNGWRPETINRVCGPDHGGLIYIGRSKGLLRSRVLSLYLAAQGKSNRPHSAGRRYAKYGYKKFFPIKKLQFRYIRTSPTRAVRLEAQLIQNYFCKFYDMPPLNFQLPKDK